MMKRLLLVLALFGASIGLAQLPTTQNHNWKITFPQFAYIWINVSDVSFDLTSTATTIDGKLASLPSVYPATESGLLSCLGINTSSFSPSGTTYTGSLSSSASHNCYFAPTTINNTASYSASYEDPDPSGNLNSADADLFILSSGRDWTVTASLTSTPSSVPASVQLYAIPLVYDDEENALETPGNTNYSDIGTNAGQLDPSSFAVTSTGVELSKGAYRSGGTSTYGYYVQGGFWQYLQPLTFLLSINLSDSYSAPSSTSSYTYVVTYTVTAP